MLAACLTRRETGPGEGGAARESRRSLTTGVAPVRGAQLVQEIESEAAAERKSTGKAVLGRAAILAQDPHDHPECPKKSPAPLVHAASKAVRLEFREAYALFVAAYREAVEKLWKGDRAAPFPPGCFPPALPFVGG